MSADACARQVRRAPRPGWLPVLAAAVGLCVVGFCSSPAAATTLLDAIRLAYQNNPTLRSQRAGLRATGEGYVQARSALGPQAALNATGGYSVARVQSGATFPGARGADRTFRGTTGTGELSIVQPLFNFGSTNANIRATEESYIAGEQDLRTAETDMIGKVITAYLDVRRDRESLAILREALANLNGEFQETKAKSELGSLTRTDSAEAEARLLSMETQIDVAQGRLAASSAAYVAVVGEPPGELAPPPPLAVLPASVQEAFAAATTSNAHIQAAVANERAARERINRAKSAYGPTLSLRFDAGVQPVQPYVPGIYDRNFTVTAVLSQPLFTSGMNASKVREAADRDSEAMLQIDVARREVIQNLSQAWSQLTTTRTALDHAKREVEAYRIAVEGSQIEERVGRRSIFELLNNEVELATARTSLAQTQHDEYLAEASVLAGMGLLEARYLTPGIALYDPAAELKKDLRYGAAPWEGLVGQLNKALAPKTAAPTGLTGRGPAEFGSPKAGSVDKP